MTEQMNLKRAAFSYVREMDFETVLEFQVALAVWIKELQDSRVALAKAASWSDNRPFDS